MGLLNLIKEDESLKFISLKEAINLLAEKTKSNIFEVTTYLLNKNVESTLDCYSRSIDYKLYVSSSPRYDGAGWVGENYSFQWLSYISEHEKYLKNSRVSVTAKYNKGCEEAFWKREDFFNLDCIKDLNIFGTEDVTFDKQQQYIWDRNYLSIIESDSPEPNENINPYEFDNYEDAYLTDINESGTKKYPLFFKNDVFTVQEAACLISNYNPNLIGNNFRKVVWLEKNPIYAEAENFIYSAVRGGLFEEIEPDFYAVRAGILKNFLSSKELFIDGFNDKQSTTFNNENLVDNTKQKNTIASLELDVAIEKNTVQKLNEEIEQLKKQLQNKDTEIAELKASQVVQQDCLLSQIFDETATKRYAPDLVLSVKLWESIYIHTPKNDSHSNMANQWIEKNTSYSETQTGGRSSIDRIREITTPFDDWGNKRNKNHAK